MSVLAMVMAAGLSVSAQCDSMADAGTYRQKPGPAAEPSDDGPYGVGAKLGEVVPRAPRPDFVVDLFYPSQPDGTFDFSGAPYPVMVFQQGGSQPADEYYFIADKLVSWGYVVAMPHYPKDLAILGPSRTTATVDFLECSNQSVSSFWRGGLDLDHLIAAGHSLGGVTADGALDDPRFNALVLLASYPQDDSHADFGGPMASIAGREDCDVLLEDSVAGYEVYGPPKMLAIIDGMTHFQFTATDEEDQADCPPGISVGEAHYKLFSVLVPFLQSKIKGELEWLVYLENPVSGVSVTLDLGGPEVAPEDRQARRTGSGSCPGSNLRVPRITP